MGLYWGQWNPGAAKKLTMGQFWSWAELYGVDYNSYAFTVVDICFAFDKELWFDLGMIIWRKNISVLQNHGMYVYNDIVKPFRVGIIHYAERVHDIHDLAMFLHPPSKKGDKYDMS